MTNVISFPDRGAMEEFLENAAADALKGLHPVQSRITYGDHWVQVVDVRARHVVFGHVMPLDEVKWRERKAGAPKGEAEEALRSTDAMHKNGLLFGLAYDFANVEGELGTTHKADVWPIDEAVFVAARAADWQIDGMDTAAQINLQIAWMAHRAWRMEQRARRS